MPCGIARAIRVGQAFAIAAMVALVLSGSTTAASAAADPFAQLRQRLAITPAQEAKFAAFVAVMQQNTAARSAFLRQNPPDRHRNALEELRVQAAAADLDARGLHRLMSAFQALYLTLSPSQKRIADQAFAAPAKTEAPPPR
jgi:LTXXQ motif family protein